MPRARAGRRLPPRVTLYAILTGRGRPRGTYDEVHRRAPRKRKVAYLVTEGQRTGARRDSIAAGTATLERTVGQRYNWRDSGLEAAKRRRGRALFEATSAQE